MAVLIEGISVIIKVPVLDEKYPGGAVRYAADCPNATFCTDGRLTRVGFMHPDDVGAFLKFLQARGLTTIGPKGWLDVAVVDQHTAAPTAPCQWIAVGKFHNGALGAWSIEPDDIPGELFAPQSWGFEGSLSQKDGYVPTGEVAERLRYEAFDGRNDIFTEVETGKKVCIGRVNKASASRTASKRPPGPPLTSIVASIVWAKAVNLLDSSLAADLLADDLHVSFQWQREDIEGRDAYLEYWRDKFGRVDLYGPRTHVELAITYTYPPSQGKKNPCLVLHQDDGLAATVILTVYADKISRIEYCLIPEPGSCVRSGHFPGLIAVNGVRIPDESEVDGSATRRTRRAQPAAPAGDEEVN